MSPSSKVSAQVPTCKSKAASEITVLKFDVFKYAKNMSVMPCSCSFTSGWSFSQAFGTPAPGLNSAQCIQLGNSNAISVLAAV